MKPIKTRYAVAMAMALAACAELGAGQAMGANGSWKVTTGDGTSWSDSGNWNGGTIPGDTLGLSSVNGDYAYFNEASPAHPNVTVDAGRAVTRLYVGRGYNIGTTSGNPLTITSTSKYIWNQNTGPVNAAATISAPLQLVNGVTVQTDTTTPLVFNGNITGTGSVGILNSSGSVTFNGSNSASGYSSNGGNATIDIYGTLYGGISQDVTRTTFVVHSAGAMTTSGFSAGRGGNVVLEAANSLTGTGGISANSLYWSTPGSSPIYGSTITINADNNYSGTTSANGLAVAIAQPNDPIINSFILVNNGHASSGSATGSGDVTASGAMLAGDGHIINTGSKGVTIANRTTAIGADPDGAGPLTAPTGVAQGRLSPGSSAGQVGTLALTLGTKGLNISGAVAGANTQALLFDLDTPSHSDLVTLAGKLTLGSGKLEFDDFAFNPLSGFGTGTYTLFQTNTAITDALGTNLTGIIDGKSATLSFANGNKDIVLTVVPEPASLSVVALGALGLLARRRRSI